MTILIALKVGDGVVLGTDSASAMVSENGHPDMVYFSGEKILNLVPGLPLGLLAYGLGGMENRSVMRLVRDLRKRLVSPDSPEWLSPTQYSVEQAADRVWEYFRRKYVSAYANHPDRPVMGLMVAGYSAVASSAEIWNLNIDRDDVAGPTQICRPGDHSGLYWQGEITALSRLLRGAEPGLHARLLDMGFTPEMAISTLDAALPLWHPAMPLQDAIELVRYLADVVVGFSRFAPGPTTVAPPIDIAAITIHEGFRWVARKQWYDPGLNRCTSHLQESGR